MSLLNQTIKRGDAITAALLNTIIDAVFKCFIAGPGLAIRRTGAGQVVIELTQSIPRRGGGSGAREILAEDRAELEAMSLDEGAFCRTTGTLKRAYRYVDDLLICYTHTETS